jgi:hypothetical protein
MWFGFECVDRGWLIYRGKEWMMRGIFLMKLRLAWYDFRLFPQCLVRRAGTAFLCFLESG